MQGDGRQKKRASDSYRTAQPPTLASFRTWGSSAGAGRMRLARIAKIEKLTLNANRIRIIIKILSLLYVF